MPAEESCELAAEDKVCCQAKVDAAKTNPTATVDVFCLSTYPEVRRAGGGARRQARTGKRSGQHVAARLPPRTHRPE